MLGYYKDKKRMIDTRDKLFLIGLLASLITFITLNSYFSFFNGEFSEKQEIWAHFGEYVGGVLSAALAFLALIALLYSINIQSKELANSVEQLEKSAKALINQNNLIQKQNFEATFFQLLKLYNEIVRDLQVNISDNEIYMEIVQFGQYSKSFKNRECIELLLKSLHHLQKNYVKKYQEEKNRLEILDFAYDCFYRDNGKIIGHYFRTMYIILEFIEDSNISKDSKKFYSNILRAQLSKYELGLLFYNSLSKYGREKMLPLVEEYELLKHLESEDILTLPDDRSLIKNVLLAQHLNLTIEH